MLLFLVIAALLVGVLALVAIRPLQWLEYERRCTGIDRGPLITNRARFATITRLVAILAILVLVAFVFGIINFESVFRTQGTANRVLLDRELQRDRALREHYQTRTGPVPPPVMPEQPRP